MGIKILKNIARLFGYSLDLKELWVMIPASYVGWLVSVKVEAIDFISKQSSSSKLIISFIVFLVIIFIVGHIRNLSITSWHKIKRRKRKTFKNIGSEETQTPPGSSKGTTALHAEDDSAIMVRDSVIDDFDKAAHAQRNSIVDIERTKMRGKHRKNDSSENVPPEK